eukprot:441318_1
MYAFHTIETWKDYRRESQNNKKIHKQWNNLLGLLPMIISQKKNTDCPHHQFTNENNLLQLIEAYIINIQSAVQKVEYHDNNIDPNRWSLQAIRTGICANCICNLIIKTNGLNDIYNRWNVSKADLKLYRKEFNNTNMIICHQPLFLKAILMKSNIKCLEKIFRLFFIDFLKNTNLNQLILKNT